MSSDQTGARSRRNFLLGAGAVGATALAGCTQSSGGGGGDTTTGGDTGTSGGTETDDGQLSGNISITGSSTVAPLASRMTTLFKKQHREVTFSLSKTGTGGGFSNHFCKGNSMINNASRPITEAESQQCSKNGVEPVQLQVATDAVTVIVNNQNDWVDCMTLDELKQIWRPENPAQTWSDVNSEWPDEQIKLYGAAETSGTFDYFTEAVVGEEGAARTDLAASTEKDNQIVSGVKQDKYAMGYLGFSYYDQNRNSITALKLNDGDGCVAPTLDTAKSGAYPLSRPLFTYPAKSALEKERVAEFCRFWLQKSTSQSIVADQVGYVPNTAKVKQNQIEKLNAAIPE